MTAKKLPALTWEERVDRYALETGFPRAMGVVGGKVFGVWFLGNDYRVKSGYFGGYPATYLRRIAALFPDRGKVLHLFSGMTDVSAFPGDTCDVRPELRPSICLRAEDLMPRHLARYDFVLADPPYSDEDAAHYGKTIVNRNRVMEVLSAGLRPGARVVWLDQVWPMHRKADWEMEGSVGIVRSTNHRVRQVFFFRRR